jgi:cobyrinic acid a,c-diamide synthase
MHPRIMIAGTGGDCGKTLISIGLAACWKRSGLAVAPFKKGPDYIDAAWLSLAAGQTAHNLDTWMMGAETVRSSFANYAVRCGINVIEGNRGLFDGEDARGAHSSAELAKLLDVPVVLVLNAQKMTRTAAAIALGMKIFDPALHISGVILNRVATVRQEKILRAAIEKEAGMPVLGIIPRIGEDLLPGRHLGLVTPQEHAEAERVIDRAADLAGRSVDINALRKIAESAKGFTCKSVVTVPAFDKPRLAEGHQDLHALTAGYFSGSAFTFYYPENLDALRQAGIKLIALDPLAISALPGLDALYIGGGFPETHAGLLADNALLRASVADAARKGLPIWAECGGLMFLAESVRWQGAQYPMAGVLPVTVDLEAKPAGHGYEEVVVDRPNPFIETGTLIRGHEFHYSRVVETAPLETVFEVRRGTGVGGGRDGILKGRALASYLHIHSLATPAWIEWVLAAASQYNRDKAAPVR